MPPKDKDAKKADKLVDPERVAREEQLIGLKRQCDGYERMLCICSEQLQRSQLEKLNLKKKIVELNDKFKQEEALTAAMCQSMNSAYRQSQKTMLGTIESHQETIQGIGDKLDESRLKLEKTNAKKDLAMAEKNQLIKEQKQRMEDMAIAFGVKLKETLEQMSQHIAGDKIRSVVHQTSGATPV